MKIKIYQVNMDRDRDNLAFMSLDFMQKKQASQEPNAALYDLVFEGKVECKNLEDVFSMFNQNHPTGYKVRSLSVSDVVEIIEDDKLTPGFYYCDSVGFKQVSFDPSKAKISDRFCDLEKVSKISVLLIQPNEYPQVVEIEDSLEAMQKVVGGDIEEYMPFLDEVALVCNEDGKFQGLPLNRAIYSEPEPVEMTYQELKEKFWEAEKNGSGHLVGRIVFTEDSFDKPYPELSRTYEISSNNKAFQPGMGGYSIFGSCLDGTDPCLRMEGYMAAEKGGQNGWRIEKCFLMEDKHEMLDIIAGDFFIAYAPIDSEKFLSLPEEMLEKYKAKFKYPERFFRAEDGIKAVPFKPVSKDMER